jgi:hypothetical protein
MEILIVVLTLALIFFSIYRVVEFFEYLRKFHTMKWKELSFERPFGISQEDFYFYPIRPLKFLPFIFSKGDINDSEVTTYKTVLKTSLMAIAFLFLVLLLIQVIST